MLVLVCLFYKSLIRETLKDYFDYSYVLVLLFLPFFILSSIEIFKDFEHY